MVCCVCVCSIKTVDGTEESNESNNDAKAKTNHLTQENVEHNDLMTLMR